MKIGFIGLGVMGAPMARHLADAGHEIATVLNRSPLPKDLNASVVASAAEVARMSEIIVTMLPDTPDVERVLLGRDGVLDGLAAGKLVIDMSSISPIATADFAAKIRQAGAGYLDAPVSGGEVGAKAASLTIMVGGPAAEFERALPILEKLGKNITLIGEQNGAGQTCKIANQIIVALNIEAVAEALVFASKAGCDPAKVRSALTGRIRLVARARSAWRAHDRPDLRAGLPHPAAPEGPQSGAGKRPRAWRGPAEHGGRAATDERLFGPSRRRGGRPLIPRPGARDPQRP